MILTGVPTKHSSDFLIISFRAHTNAISDCCFSLDGHYLCTAGWDEVLKLWDVRTGEFRSHGAIILEQGHIGIVGCCTFSKDGEFCKTPFFPGHLCTSVHDIYSR